MCVPITHGLLVPIATKEPWKNVWFEMEDIRKPLRWGNGTFDLIHARDLSMGVSNRPPFILSIKITRPIDQ